MEKPKMSLQDHRKLMHVWIKEEEERKKAEQKLAELAIDGIGADQIEILQKKAVETILPLEKQSQIEKKARYLFEKALESSISKRAKIGLPSQYEREQKIMNFRRLLPPNKTIISWNAMESREDIFPPRIRKEGKIFHGFNNQEGNPDVNRIENWSIRCYAWGKNGGDAYWTGIYWRYRIWVPNFDTSTQADRRLVIDPRAVLYGFYSLYAQRLFWFWLSAPSAGVRLHFWTGKWHFHYTGSAYEPEWSGWRRSRDIISRSISSGNIYQGIQVPYPGTLVTTPERFDPPGVYTTPNPINEYGLVKPFDVVDFYVSPAIYAETESILSYAEINFSAVDVPFITVSFEEGYLL